MGTKPRVAVDDARSESSVVNAKERVVSSTVTSKSKKGATHTSNNVVSSSKTASAAVTSAIATEKQNGPVELEAEVPHIDWATMPIHHLHSYRSAYRLQIPSSYTQSHADLLYNSCELALRAPSQVLARRKAHDLKSYRRKQSQLASNSRAAVNGISKSTRGSRTKDKERDSRRRTNTTTNGKDKDTNHNDSSTNLLTVDAPPSPTSYPSNHDSLSNPADNASRTSRLTPLEAPQQQQHEEEKEDTNTIPHSLNQADPDATILGSQSPGSLATSIRKHFNAQQLNEAETIARFTYVMRQQGSSTSSRVLPLAHRLPKTLPGLISSGTATGNAASTLAAAAAASGSTAAGIASSSSSRPHAHSALAAMTAASTLGGSHVQIEGSWGDGAGGIMGTTSCGRQVRIPGEGGGGTFRLRFRP